ncbi:Hydroxyethylthiazole kinase [Escherichia coli B7A]|nr:Hydroxyethylthiazole kinase [Escherichia coli B7A]
MQVDLLSSAQSAHALHLFHQHSPLVHCMTNDVVQTFTANTLLALGASPAMVIETEEASQFAAIASALLINVGTLTQPRAQAMRAAVEQAKSSQTPWTLDPVAVGALDYRRHFCHELLSFKPAAIRGNASEIMALAGIANGGRGVDTTDAAANAIPAAQTLARETGAIVVVTGEVDYVTDGHRAVGIHGGDPLMTKVVGNWLCIIGGCRCLLCVTRRYAGKCRICLSLDETSRRARSRQKRGARQFCSTFP